MRTIAPQHGLWTVLSYAGTNDRHQHLWLCRCACGREEVRLEYTLTLGRSKSCRPCSARAVAARCHKTHGQSKSLIYRRWIAMKTRCTNPKARNWNCYGALGVKIAPKWEDDFEAFRDYIGEPPAPEYSIGLINRLGNYEPGNVAWMKPCDVIEATRQVVRR